MAGFDAVAEWRGVDTVCFDVDSTVCVDEAIDRLAEVCGVAQAVQDWTEKAMGGAVLFQDAIKARLEIMQPSRAQVAQCQKDFPAELTPGVRELVTALRAKGVSVFLVSGGFRSLILPVAEELGIPPDNIYANVIRFDDEGKYASFDAEQPTSRTGGKPEVVRRLKEQGHKRVAVIGDGVTDMEAKPPADLFIGFGGNRARDKVKAGADWWVTSFEPLLEALTPPAPGSS